VTWRKHAHIPLTVFGCGDSGANCCDSDSATPVFSLLFSLSSSSFLVWPATMILASLMHQQHMITDRWLTSQTHIITHYFYTTCNNHTSSQTQWQQDNRRRHDFAPSSASWWVTLIRHRPISSESNLCCHLVSRFEYTPSCHMPHGPLLANKTSSTKPEVHNVLHCHQRRTKSQPWVICTENYDKFGPEP